MSCRPCFFAFRRLPAANGARPDTGEFSLVVVFAPDSTSSVCCLSVVSRYMLGVLSSVLEEVEAAFDGYQFYKASQVTRSLPRVL